MTKQTWIIAAILSALLLLGIGAWSLGNGRAQLERDLARLRAEVETLSTSTNRLATLLAERDGTINDLQEEKQKAGAAQKSLEQEMRAALQSKDVTISELQGKLTVDILDRIMFDSGEAVLKPEGETVLEQVASVLAQFPNRQVHVIGHTDNIPIKASARSRFASNWELSTARSTAAVRFLVERAGVDPQRLGAVGYGEFHPLADNQTAEGRARNRRIAVVVLSEERVGSDSLPGRAPTPPEPAGETAQ